MKRLQAFSPQAGTSLLAESCSTRQSLHRQLPPGSYRNKCFKTSRHIPDIATKPHQAAYSDKITDTLSFVKRFFFTSPFFYTSPFFFTSPFISVSFDFLSVAFFSDFLSMTFFQCLFCQSALFLKSALFLPADQLPCNIIPVHAFFGHNDLQVI